MKLLYNIPSESFIRFAIYFLDLYAAFLGHWPSQAAYNVYNKAIVVKSREHMNIMQKHHPKTY